MTTRILTVSQFLRTKIARDALRSGHTYIGDYSADDNGLVGLAFRGAYTLPELEALSADLRAMQAAYDGLTHAAVMERVNELRAERINASTTTCRAPAHWASYLINGDASGLSNAERRACDSWIADLGLGSPIDCQPYGFAAYHDAMDYALACECEDYTFSLPASHELEAIDAELAAFGVGLVAEALAAACAKAAEGVSARPRR